MKKKLLVLILVLVFTFGAVACGEQSHVTDVTVWGTHSTLKVMRDVHTYEQYAAKLDVSLAKGETESGQLQITAHSSVRNFELVKGTIVNENDTEFPHDDIEIDIQRYVNVVQKTAGQENDAYPVGWTPDMLMSMEIAKEYGLNTISTGCNQGLTVKFKADSTTESGIYTGNFTLRVDEKTFSIPVSVEVWDFDVSKSYGKTVMYIEQGQLGYGELDNSDAMYTAYYETLLNEYKTCGGLLPNSYNLSTYVETLDKYWDNPNFTTYELPYSIDWYLDQSKLYNYVYELAVNSTPEKLYLSKAVILPIDEPVINEDSYDRLNVVRMQISAIKEMVWDNLISQGFFDDYGGETGDFALNMKDALDFPCVITSSDIEYWGDGIDTYCPPIQFYNSTNDRRVFSEHATKSGYEQWYYTCLQPVYPYPSHHIDDYLLGSRTMRWMQKDYDLEGYLYWCCNQYSQNVEGGYVSIDPYTTAGRYWYGGGTYNGDGFLFYPGAKYGQKTPFGSIRLEALRDGQEDYNMLCLYDELLAEMSTYYGKTFTADETLNLVYDSLYKGTVYNVSDSVFNNAREKVAGLVNAAKNLKFHYDINGIGDSETMQIYAINGAKIYVNGNLASSSACGNGIEAQYNYSLANSTNIKVEIEYNGQRTEVLNIVRNAQRAIAASNVETATTLSEGGTKDVDSDKLNLTLVGKTGSVIEQMRFIPTITIRSTVFGTDVNRLYSFGFDLEQTSGDGGTFELCFLFNDGKMYIYDTLYAEAGETINIWINDVDTKFSDYTGGLRSIVLRFKNLDDNEQVYGTREFTLSNFTYEKEAQ